MANHINGLNNINILNNINGLKCVYKIDAKNSVNVFEIKYDNYDESAIKQMKNKVNELKEPLDKYIFYIYTTYLDVYGFDCTHLKKNWYKINTLSIEKLLTQDILN
jgi:hypothetical protein